MTNEMLENLKKIITKHVKDHFQITPLTEENWYHIRKEFLKQNNKILKNIKIELQNIYKENFTEEDFFYMQKLFLIYQEQPPHKLLNLSWENIKLILNMCEEKKRIFYVELCLCYNLEHEVLKNFILNDIYEKTVIIIKHQERIQEDLIDKLLDIYPMIWK